MIVESNSIEKALEEIRKKLKEGYRRASFLLIDCIDEFEQCVSTHQYNLKDDTTEQEVKSALFNTGVVTENYRTVCVQLMLKKPVVRYMALRHHRPKDLHQKILRKLGEGWELSNQKMVVHLLNENNYLRSSRSVDWDIEGGWMDKIYLACRMNKRDSLYLIQLMTFNKKSAEEFETLLECYRGPSESILK